MRSLLNPTANPSDLKTITFGKDASVMDTNQDEKGKSAKEEKNSGAEEASAGAPRSTALQCRMSISPVSDSSSARGLAGFVSGRVKITHYLLELTEFDENVALGDSAKKSAGAATDEGFSVIG